MESILHSLESARSQEAPRPQQDEKRAVAVNDAIIRGRQLSLTTFCSSLRNFASSSAAAARQSDLDAYASIASAAAASKDDEHPSSVSSNSNATATWLYELCTKVPTPLPPFQFSLAVLSAITSSGSDESKMQSSLFELFGEGETSIEALFEVMGRTDEINSVTEGELKIVAQLKGDVVASASGTASASAALPPSILAEHEHRLQQLRSEAYTAVDIANTLKSEHNIQNNDSTNYNSRGTHSVKRASDKEAEKMYKRAMKQAASATAKAREAGALTESDELYLNGDNGNPNLSAMEQMMLRNEEAMLYSNNGDNIRGLDGMNSQQIQSMKRNLLPEGTREYNDSQQRGLPRGTIREIKEGLYEKVIIPAPILEKSQLHARLNLDEVMGVDADERLAFEGCDSLNPMQSTVFDAAYNTRENLLICAPTGK